MKRFFVGLAVACFFMSLAISAMAVGPGKTVDFDEKTTGKVVFDGKAHADAKLKCNDCHTKIWPMKKGGKQTMADMKAGKSCGTCHDGKKAFGVTECAKCHKK